MSSRKPPFRLQQAGARILAIDTASVDADRARTLARRERLQLVDPS